MTMCLHEVEMYLKIYPLCSIGLLISRNYVLGKFIWETLLIMSRGAHIYLWFQGSGARRYKQSTEKPYDKFTMISVRT